MATSKGANTYNRQNWEDSVRSFTRMVHNSICLTEKAVKGDEIQLQSIIAHRVARQRAFDFDLPGFWFASRRKQHVLLLLRLPKLTVGAISDWRVNL